MLKNEERTVYESIHSGRRAAEAPAENTAARTVSAGLCRNGEKGTSAPAPEEGGSIRAKCAVLLGIISLLFCGTYLTLVLAGKPASSGGFPEAGSALREALLEEEAVAVFLGIEKTEPSDPFSEEAILTMGEAEGSFLPEKPNVGGEERSFWDYIVGLLAPLLETS